MINKSNIVSVEKKYGLTNEHEIYKVVFNTDKICFVPVDTANTDYQAILTWIADGGTVIDNGGGE
jgi:hypothetical protein